MKWGIMALVFEFRFLLISHLFLLSAKHGYASHGKCPLSFDCGKLRRIQFPLTTAEFPDCGLLLVHDCDDPNPYSNKTIQLEKNGRPFLILNGVFPQQNVITVFDQDLHHRLQSQGSCEAFNNNISILASSPLISLDIKFNITLFKCNPDLNISAPSGFIKHTCAGFHIYHYNQLYDLRPDQESHFSACSTLVLPRKDLPDSKDLQSFLSAQMNLDTRLSDDCDKCYNHEGGRCKLDSNNKFSCDKAPPDPSKFWKLALGLALGLFLGLLGILIIWLRLRQYYKQKHPSSNVQLQSIRNNTIDPYSNADSESGRIYLGVPLFSYEELKKATNNFDRSRELGIGGFGSVYYGKLQDGREVAVKRLYDHNYRRVEQFMNEIEMLTRLHHPNLVSLYGCTSCHSRELLLVYEYIPNKTVSYHLHGEPENCGLLPWPVRIKIARETATALAFLHASDTIHRDVKTNNILLDNKFSVKVADFGLSRLFPDDVTHVSTTPQGTPGYVDPDYHLCY
ncbi:LEAF RUST 10 DISEASE-RESISTANCE LOCUS RECEPTOR-LIKE PROTEIN KINASE-like 1.1 [Prosopis cineraria]|uniref:LEAF RUST 10 DISEASE-RESISTANCE LOCUS RECEPTOR-LIKE PROTEIN KINASE-like 1.1 n=1 Tax=Prosopis cineraria TaxID=364024 RepID=UPI00240EC1BD|nr:LEAF RUST 10 DISEASE-RESISTANCE LOCUS RECEPTOR-LIKE PROTEIN KINASE-like 1.1 [Prosopis cineraria]